MWKIVFYPEDDRSVPVREFLDSLEKKIKRGFDWTILRLSERSILDGEPLTNYLGNELWEHRENWGTYTIIFSYFSGWRLVFLHGCMTEADWEIPDSEIEIASKRLENFATRGT